LIQQATALHDVGKIGIPDRVLLKPDHLAAKEFGMVQRHCEFGARILLHLPKNAEEFSEDPARLLAPDVHVAEMTSSPMLRIAALIAMTHHEKWDGSGYPLGLAGEAIPLEGRIAAVADVFDALSNPRPYKPAYPCEKCFQHLNEGRGRHFDPQVLDAFLARKEEVVGIHARYGEAS
jgi:putative two-component system response regulator